jgi:hypothetical protein
MVSAEALCSVMILILSGFGFSLRLSHSGTVSLEFDSQQAPCLGGGTDQLVRRRRSFSF